MITDSHIYIQGLFAGIYFIVCLICGLQLCFGIITGRHSSNIVFLRLVGSIMLLMSFGGLSYILSTVVEALNFMSIVGNAVDFFLFIGIAFVACLLYYSNKPTKITLVLIAVPFLLIAVLFFVFPSSSSYLPDLAMFVLMCIYAFFGISMRHHEKRLDDIYSNPDSHSLKWIRGIIALCVGWWTIRIIFLNTGLLMWYDIALYLYMTYFVLFAYTKVSKFEEPVSVDTRQQIEQLEFEQIETSVHEISPMQKKLAGLMEQDKLYLNPDLTVDDVASRLGATPRALSLMLHIDMHTNFCQYVNEYRIEHAKNLLKASGDNIDSIVPLCGFNSRPSFYRSFVRITGKTPSEWRNS